MSTLARQLRAIIDAPDFTAALVALAEQAELDPAQHAEIATYVARKHRGLVELLDALGAEPDEAELYRTLAAAWLEFRFEWQRCNMVVNYQVVRTGEFDKVPFVCAAITSGILAQVEELLAVEDRERLAGFAVELIHGAQQDLEERFGDGIISLSPMA